MAVDAAAGVDVDVDADVGVGVGAGMVTGEDSSSAGESSPVPPHAESVTAIVAAAKNPVIFMLNVTPERGWPRRCCNAI